MKNMEKEKVRLPLPNYVENICKALENAGYAAYAVGGCVRDLLRNKKPHDFDIATSAKPAEIKKLFSHTVDTGIRHGTVTVILPEGIAEVTTFRRDGIYTDSRHPDSVSFVKSVEDDLSRRDFTVNAIAYSPLRGICDPFDGYGDIERRILRTVGRAELRFKEDALRILRLYRFAAQLSFSIEENTQDTALKFANTVSGVSKERIYAETEKILMFANENKLKEASYVLEKLLLFADFSEQNVNKIAGCFSLSGKWALLCGEYTVEILRSLHAPKKVVLSAGELSRYKEGEHIVMDVANLRYNSPEDFFAFIQDEDKRKKWNSALESGVPRSMRELALSGTELKKMGYKGEEIGIILNELFLYVIQNPADNKKEQLKEVAQWIYKQKCSVKE